MRNLENSFFTYISQISKIPLLSREEEYKLSKRAKSGERKAKNKLIQANLRFVVQTAKRYSNCGLPLVDLISEGNLGLIRAADSFDPDKGFHFISYAVYWIKQSILKAISEKSKLVRLPLNLNNNLSTIESSMRESDKDLFSDETLENLSERVNMKKKDLVNLIEITRTHSSLDMTIGSEKTTRKELKDFIEDKGAENPEDLAVEDALCIKLKETLNDLTAQEVEIIRARFGLDSKKPKTLLEIGKDRGLTKERIRQIEKQALQKLKKSVLKKDLGVYFSA